MFFLLSPHPCHEVEVAGTGQQDETRDDIRDLRLEARLGLQVGGALRDDLDQK